MIDEYFADNPHAKWALLGLAAVYIWFMILVPLFMLLKKYDPDRDPPKGVTFFRFIVGVIPAAFVGYYYWQASHQPPPPPPPPPEFDWEGFSEQFQKRIAKVEDQLAHPKVIYLPNPGK
jgi:drug/metabolite transporter (DMT)-like permease